MNGLKTASSRTQHIAVASAAAAVGLGLAILVSPNLASAGSGLPSTVLAPPGSPSELAAPTDIAWQEDYAAALADAARTNEPVLLRFTAYWCAPCRVMDARVFPDDRVKSAIAGHAIPVKLDADRPEVAEVARRYGVVGIPTLILVDASGKELARGGFMSAEQLVEFLGK